MDKARPDWDIDTSHHTISIPSDWVFDTSHHPHGHTPEQHNLNPWQGRNPSTESANAMRDRSPPRHRGATANRSKPSSCRTPLRHRHLASSMARSAQKDRRDRRRSPLSGTNPPPPMTKMTTTFKDEPQARWGDRRGTPKRRLQEGERRHKAPPSHAHETMGRVFTREDRQGRWTLPKQRLQGGNDIHECRRCSSGKVEHSFRRESHLTCRQAPTLPSHHQHQHAAISVQPLHAP
ncbi:unnamed protein product [Urochloa humidicola]